MRLLLLLAVLFYNAAAVDAAVGLSAAAVSAAVSAVGSGASVGIMYNGVQNNGYSVTCGIQVENWTRFTLVSPMVRMLTGAVTLPPRAIMPSKKEGMAVRKTSGTGTGTYGTVSWLVSDQNRRVVVMWSVPYIYASYSNYLAVGISTGNNHRNSLFDDMYYSSETWFQRKVYHYNISPVLYRDDLIEVVGTMGTGSKAIARIIVRPRRESDLSDIVRQTLSG